MVKERLRELSHEPKAAVTGAPKGKAPLRLISRRAITATDDENRPQSARPQRSPARGGKVELMMQALARLGAVSLLLIAVGAGTTTALMHVKLKLQILELGYSLGREAQKERELEQAAERLGVELALLKSPANVEGTARNEMGLRPPNPSQLRTVVQDAHGASQLEAPRKLAASGGRPEAAQVEEQEPPQGGQGPAARGEASRGQVAAGQAAGPRGGRVTRSSSVERAP